MALASGNFGAKCYPFVSTIVPLRVCLNHKPNMYVWIGGEIQGKKLIQGLEQSSVPSGPRRVCKVAEAKFADALEHHLFAKRGIA